MGEIPSACAVVYIHRPHSTEYFSSCPLLSFSLFSLNSAENSNTSLSTPILGHLDIRPGRVAAARGTVPLVLVRRRQGPAGDGLLGPRAVGVAVGLPAGVRARLVAGLRVGFGDGFREGEGGGGGGEE